MNKKEFIQNYFKVKIMNLDHWRDGIEGGLDKTVVHIPARSGSTRIKDKNIQSVSGLPLLAYSVLLAKCLKGVDRVIINTDSRLYADIAQEYGAEVLFIRPKELAGSTANTFWAYYYALRFFIDQGYPVKTIITLSPTSPFRNLARTQDMVDSLRCCGMLQTCFRVNVNLRDVVSESPLTKRIPFARDEETVQKSTLVKFLGNFNGQHVVQSDITARELVFIDDPIELIDIDTKEDLRLMEFVIDNRLYDFGVSLC